MNCLKWLVEESSAYVELAVRDGQTSLLHHAASEGMEQCLTYLLAFMAKRKITTGMMKYIIRETSPALRFAQVSLWVLHCTVCDMT